MVYNFSCKLKVEALTKQIYRIRIIFLNAAYVYITFYMHFFFSKYDVSAVHRRCPIILNGILFSCFYSGLFRFFNDFDREKITEATSL